jgi:hypothetical protein
LPAKPAQVGLDTVPSGAPLFSQRSTRKRIATLLRGKGVKDTQKGIENLVRFEIGAIEIFLGFRRYYNSRSAISFLNSYFTYVSDSVKKRPESRIEFS